MAARVLEGISVEDHVEMGIGEYFWRVAEKYGERIFQIDGSTGDTETFTSVKCRAVRVAIYLKKLGISENDAIILCDNVNMDNIIPIMALWLIGAIPAPVYGSWEDYYLAHAIKNIKPKAIISFEEKLSNFKEIYDKNLEPKPPIVSSEQIKQISLQKTETENIFKPVKVDPHSIGYIIFSSGTTALPKAICISHFAPLSGPCRRNRENNYVWDTPIIRQFYYNWISALWGIVFNVMFAQPTLVVSSKSIIDLLGLIEKYRIETIMPGQLFITELLRLDPKTIKNIDLSSVRNLFFGGFRMSAQNLMRFKNIFQAEKIFITYAATEIGTVAAIKDVNDKEVFEELESCGKPTENVKIKIVNPETEQILGPNDRGEIRVKSPYSLICLKDDPEKTSQLFDREGFIKTKDLGYYDEDGDLYVIGRLGSTFKYKMYHFHAEDVQAVLKNHPAIEDAVVLGIEHEIDENRPAACIKLKKGHNVSKEEISDYVAENMSEFHRPIGGVKFFDSFPLTSSEKASLMELKKIFLADQ